jgi:hypothetical protein
VLFTLCLDQPGVILCWVDLLAHILGGLIEQTLQLDLLYAIHVIQEHYACLIGTWSDHPGKPYNHKAHGSALAE